MGAEKEHYYHEVPGRLVQESGLEGQEVPATNRTPGSHRRVSPSGQVSLPEVSSLSDPKVVSSGQMIDIVSSRAASTGKMRLH
jgi:hypothetical protein